jgi:hypothetical protein
MLGHLLFAVPSRGRVGQPDLAAEQSDGALFRRGRHGV